MKNKNLPKMALYVPPLDEKAVKLITKLIFREKNPEIPDKVDLIFLFGSTSSIPKRKKVLDKFLAKKVCDKILLTGGINPRRTIFEHKGKFGVYDLRKVSEAEILEKEMELDKRGNLKIYKETKSVNTKDNVKFALEILDFSKFKNILFITRSYHVGRCYLTLKKYVSKDTNIFYASYDSEARKGFDEVITRDNWYKSKDGKSKVWAEFERIINYGRKKGDIEFAEVKELVKEIEGEIKNVSNRKTIY